MSSQALPQAILLDRDGVINVDSPDYILAPDQWHAIPGSLEAIAKLTQAGIAIAIVSNQSAVGRGMMDADTFNAIHQKMMQAIEDAGGKIAHIAYCPHAPDAQCPCRKPLPGMLLESLQALACAPESALMIGDSFRDVQAAHAAGVPAMLVQSGYGDAAQILEKSRELMPNILAFPTLSDAVEHILEPTCF